MTCSEIRNSNLQELLFFGGHVVNGKAGMDISTKATQTQGKRFSRLSTDHTPPRLLCRGYLPHYRNRPVAISDSV